MWLFYHGAGGSFLNRYYLGSHSAGGDREDGDRGWDHEGLVRLTGIQKEDPITYFVDRLVEVTEQDRVNRLREVGEKLLQGELGSSPSGVGNPNPESLDFQYLCVWQRSPQIGRVGVAVDNHRAGGFSTHTVDDILPDDVAAVDGDVGLSHRGTNVRVDFVPAIEVCVRDYGYASWHVLRTLTGKWAD